MCCVLTIIVTGQTAGSSKKLRWNPQKFIDTNVSPLRETQLWPSSVVNRPPSPSRWMPCSHLPENGEVQLPVMVADMLDRGRAQVRVLSSGEKWFGVTYREDKPFVRPMS